MRGRIVVLGGGHGVASVLRALREEPIELTVIVTIADDGGSSGELLRRWGGAAVGDMRRSLAVLGGEDNVLARALTRPLKIHRVGEHPLGNLLLRSLATGFGDLELASEWLGEQLGLTGRVMPASAGPVCLVADCAGELVRGESAIGAETRPIRRLLFEPSCPEAPAAALAAIEDARCVLLAPGSLFTSTLATAALPAIAQAIGRTRAYVLWICNLEPELPETADLTAEDHLEALRSHGVRVDGVLHDPGARLGFAPGVLADERLPELARSLESSERGVHDPTLLRAALNELCRERANVADGQTDAAPNVP